MITIYLEEEIADYPRTKAFLQKHPKARVIPIKRYSEVFNRKNQDFRAQKKAKTQTFILAKKVDHFVLEVPKCSSLQTPQNYYFSHLYNCPFDCEYCYLQGMYRSAAFVWFVNYEDFEIEIQSALHPSEKSTFFSGYDYDSLAMEHTTHFAKHFVPLFETLENVQMELRTKSVNIHSLLKMEAPKNTFVTWTLSPNEITQNFEKGTAPFQKRLEAIQKLLEINWRVTIRMEPIVHVPDWENIYSEFFSEMNATIDVKKIETISFGHLRFPKEIFKKMKKMLPKSKLLAKYFEERKNGAITYAPDREEEMTAFFLKKLSEIYPREKIFYFTSDHEYE